MRDDLGDLGRLHAVVEGQSEMEGHLDRLVARDQHRERDDAAVARAQAGTLPDIAEQAFLRVFVESRSDGTDIRRRQHADWSRGAGRPDPVSATAAVNVPSESKAALTSFMSCPFR